MNQLLVLFFVLSGIFNVLLVKWMNTLLVTCSDGEVRYFQHPVFLTLLMFVGEFLCFIIYKIVYYFLDRRGNGSVNMNIITSGERDFKAIKMFPASILNCIATILLFTGLYLTFASSFQMIRISTIIFIALFSAIHLNTTLIGRHWIAMFMIMCGVTIIVLTDMQRIKFERLSLAHESTNAILTGDLLIICGCIIEAAKMIYEEKYIKRIEVPVMQAIGLEGLFGIGITTLITIAMNYIPIPVASPFNYNSRNVFDDIFDIVVQIQSNYWLMAALLVFVLSTLIHGYSSLSIIKFSSTSNLILADSMRNCIVWVLAILFEWEQFNFIALCGFLILQVGLINYRQALFWEWYRLLMLQLMRYRYEGMNDATADTIGSGSGGGGGIIQASNRPADVI